MTVIIATSRSGTRNLPAAAAARMSRRARGPRPSAEFRARRPSPSTTLLSIGCCRWRRPAKPVALGEHLGRVVQPSRQLFDVVGVPLESVGDRSLEQLLLGVEVIVEGADAEVGGFGDDADGRVRATFGEQRLGRLDECQRACGPSVDRGRLAAPLEGSSPRPLRLQCHQSLKNTAPTRCRPRGGIASIGGRQPCPCDRSATVLAADARPGRCATIPAGSLPAMATVKSGRTTAATAPARRSHAPSGSSSTRGRRS